MTRMFMSYRRSDSISESGRIHDHLEREFGGRNIFKDVDDIQPGYDFRKVLDDEVSQCDVLLVIIGPNWVNASDADGNLRLHNPDDFVRIEVESGLKRGDDVLVIPVLINNAIMPKASELPPSLQNLTYRNAVIIRNDPDFNRDMRRLIDYVKRYTKSQQSGVSPKWIGGGVIVSVALILGLLVAINGIPSSPAPTPTTPPTNTVANALVASPTHSVPVVLTLEDEDTNDLYLAAQTEAGNANYPEAVALYSQVIDGDQQYAPAYLGRALAQSSGFGDYSAAIADLEEAIVLDPQYAEAYRYLGRFQYFEGELDAVEDNLQRALALNPSDVEARLWLAEYYINYANFEAAAEQYDALLNAPEMLDQDRLYDAWMGRGYTQSAMGDDDSALLAYDNARTINPDRPEAYSAMGDLQRYRGDNEEAVSNLTIAIEKSPNDPDNYYARGVANMELERYTEAVTDFDQVLRLAPNYIPAYIGRGWVYYLLDNYEAAIADYGQAIRRDESSGEAFFQRGLAHFDNGYYEQAIDDFSTTIDFDYQTGDAYAYRGLAYQFSDESGKAQDDLELALVYGVSDDLRYDVLSELGWIVMEDDRTNALEYFAEAIAHDPTRALAYEGEATVFIQAASNADHNREAFNDWLAALDSLTRGIDNTTDEAMLYFRRGTVNQEIGMMQDDPDYLRAAVDDYQVTLELDDTIIDAYIHLAEIALLLDDYSRDDALQFAEAAYELDRTDTYALGTLAAVHQAMSDYDAAREFYQLAIDNSEDSDERNDYRDLYDAVPVRGSR